MRREGVPLYLCISLCVAPGDSPATIVSFALDHTSIRVTWAPPSLPNGEITQYTIYYSPPTSNLTLVGGVRAHDLEGLSPHTNYSIRVSASTAAGEGPLSIEGVTATSQDGELPEVMTFPVHTQHMSDVYAANPTHCMGKCGILMIVCPLPLYLL